jgi:transcriptional regulator with XRE-family HTH domain
MIDIEQDAPVKDESRRLREEVAAELRKLVGNVSRVPGRPARAEADRGQYKEIARLAGIDETYMYRILNGDRNLTLDTLQSIAKALNLNVRVRFSRIKKH